MDDHTMWIELATAANARAELDCHAPIDRFDGDLILEHLGHSCGGVVPVLRQSWGRLKAYHR